MPMADIFDSDNLTIDTDYEDKFFTKSEYYHYRAMWKSC